MLGDEASLWPEPACPASRRLHAKGAAAKRSPRVWKLAISRLPSGLQTGTDRSRPRRWRAHATRTRHNYDELWEQVVEGRANVANWISTRLQVNIGGPP